MKDCINNKRRLGIKTNHGIIMTPVFLPDATRGFVKMHTNLDLKSTGVGPMVVNTFHLYLQPGLKIIKKAGGVHKFMNYSGPLISDSGGYQVFSLVHQNSAMGKIREDGVEFRSPIDGSKHFLTPEKSIQIQFDLGTDGIVCFDDCPPNHASKKNIHASVKRTISWAKRCRKEYDKQVKKRGLSKKNKPLIFGVIQGGNYPDLRKACAEELIKLDFDGYGFGARPVDADGKFLADILQFTANLIPENKIRFALGMGTPEDIVRSYAMGWDIFDCVIPTREGRHGRLFIWKIPSKTCLPFGKGEGGGGLSMKFQDITAERDRQKNKLQTNSPSASSGQAKFQISNFKTININNSKFATDMSPINADSSIEELRTYSKAFLHHLFKLRDPLGMRLASLNNLEFYQDLMRGL